MYVCAMHIGHCSMYECHVYLEKTDLNDAVKKCVLLFEEYLNFKKTFLLPKLFFSEYLYVFSDLEGLGPTCSQMIKIL